MNVDFLDLAGVQAVLAGQDTGTISGKFVLMEKDGSLVLIMGKISDYPYHANLVAKYCELNDIPSFWEKKPDIYEIVGRKYQISGGYFEFKGDSRIASFSGASTAYGRYDIVKMRISVEALSIFRKIRVICR